MSSFDFNPRNGSKNNFGLSRVASSESTSLGNANEDQSYFGLPRVASSGSTTLKTGTSISFNEWSKKLLKK